MKGVMSILQRIKTAVLIAPPKLFAAKIVNPRRKSLYLPTKRTPISRKTPGAIWTGSLLFAKRFGIRSEHCFKEFSPIKIPRKLSSRGHSFIPSICGKIGICVRLWKKTFRSCI
jgi:hypothetical protein